MKAHTLNLLEGQIPNTNSSQVLAEHYIDHYFRHFKLENSVIRVMDLGCGAGNSVERFRQKDSSVEWIGLDIEDSPEAKTRTRTDAQFFNYDGIHIPFDDNCFDLIFSKQVFEHVRYPTELLKEIHRVLKPNGYFIGSTSYLESYHSYSFWNYTPYGFRVLLEEANLQLLEIRAGIDAFALLTWSISSRLGAARKLMLKLGWWNESPFNRIVDVFGRIRRMNPSSINVMKLSVCGQFCFMAGKLDTEISHSVADAPTT